MLSICVSIKDRFIRLAKEYVCSFKTFFHTKHDNDFLSSKYFDRISKMTVTELEEGELVSHVMKDKNILSIEFRLHSLNQSVIKVGFRKPWPGMHQENTRKLVNH